MPQKSKDSFVKCPKDGELPSERKALPCGLGLASRFTGHKETLLPYCRMKRG